MANENRIIKVEISLTDDGHYEVAVTKEFEERYGGGSQVFLDRGGSLHHALDVARSMVTLSPGSRTDAGIRDSVADFDPNPATNRRRA